MTTALALPQSRALPLRSQAGAPRFAIVMPVFKHSVLMTEAIDSALREARLSDGIVMIVNDGCPYLETHEVCATFVAAEPERVAYIRTANGGLSAARNRGIRHILAFHPYIEAIYLLDADNRLSTGAMRRALARLAASGADWVYPTIDKFGMEWSGDYSAPYSVLRHLFQNVCEAGSLIHRRVFEAGVCFDETMRQGYEDWEFWLQCVDAGFRGVPCPEFGFQYRARRESMVRNSDRDGAAILAYMHRKHKRLYSWKNILRLEHYEAPRFCVVDTARQHYMLTSIPGETTKTGETVEIDTLYWAAHHYPVHSHFPHFVVLLHDQMIAELVRIRLADWVFWQIEDLLETHTFVYVFLEYREDEISFSTATGSTFPDIATRGPHVLATTSSCLRDCALDPSTDWIDTLWNERPDPKVGVLTLSAPFSSHTLRSFGTKDTLRGLFSLLAQLRASPFRQEKAWEWRAQNALNPANTLFRELRQYMSAQGPLGRCSLSNENEMAVLLPVLFFGGVEQVGIQIARQFRAAGWRTRLIVTEGTTIKAPDRLQDAFDAFLLLNDRQHATWNPSGYTYYGHDLQKWASEGRLDRLTGLMAGCAVVVNGQAMHSNEAMGWMRRQGVVTITSLHLIDRDQFMAPQGHIYWMLAYEHAYDIIAAPSQKLLNFCAAAGVPTEKLLHLPNAPTFAVTDAMRARRLRALEQEAEAAVRRPLRILSIGRLDRQKGVERLLGLIEATRAEGVPVEWRLVGSRVIEDTPNGGTTFGPNVSVQPAVYDRAAVIDHLLWADAVVLLSHWEGSPLLILEAQSLGTIPIATNVGAISEMIHDGVDGIVVPNGSLQAVVGHVAGQLRQLEGDSVLRLHLGRNAMNRLQYLSWENSTADLLRRVTQSVSRI